MFESSSVPSSQISGSRLRVLRACEALVLAGTSDAKKLLTDLSTGGPPQLANSILQRVKLLTR